MNNHQSTRKHMSLPAYPLMEEDISKDKYFLSLVKAAGDKGLLSQEEKDRIQTDLQDLFINNVNKYTSLNSSSIRVELADQLISSIYYCLDIYFKSIIEMEYKVGRLKRERLCESYQKGKKTVTALARQSQALLGKVQRQLPSLRQFYYRDTVYEGLKQFFLFYDVNFAAHLWPGSIDYPLAIQIEDAPGVSYVDLYLNALYKENQFLKHWDPQSLDQALLAYKPDYADDYFNIYSVMLERALIIINQGKDPLTTYLSQEEVEDFWQYLSKMDIEEAQTILFTAFNNLNENFQHSPAEIDYAKETVRLLLVSRQAMRLN